MIDQDGDGRVTEDDLRVMLSNLGTYILARASVITMNWLMDRSNPYSKFT